VVQLGRLRKISPAGSNKNPGLASVAKEDKKVQPHAEENRDEPTSREWQQREIPTALEGKKKEKPTAPEGKKKDKSKALLT
jgi:hypothetical protein